MIHFYSSEVSAFITFIALLLIFVLLIPCGDYIGFRASTPDILVFIVCGFFACRLNASGTPCRWPSGVDYSGQVALVSGATSGVGYAVAEELAMHGWTVILAGRDATRLLQAKQLIMDRLHRAKSAGVVKVIGTVDLTSDRSIRAYCAEVIAARKELPVGLLVNAAGALHRHLHFVGEGPFSSSNQKPTVAWSTIEGMLAANAVGPFLLTQLLLPVLEETAKRSQVTSRVVNVASSCHSFLGLGWKSKKDPIAMITGLEIMGKRRLQADNGVSEEAVATNAVNQQYCICDFSWGNFVGYYGLSKLCVMWNTRILTRMVATRWFDPSPHQSTSAASAATEPSEKGQGYVEINNKSDSSSSGRQQTIFVACTHPGIITTPLYRDLLPKWVLNYIIYYPSLLVGKTWRESAQSTLKAAIEPDNMIPGGYYLCSGEYGASSGVSCVSAHAQNATEEQAYCRWLMSKMEAGGK